MKFHVGADVNSGQVHTVSVTAANESDISELPHLVREDDLALFGDKGYVNNKLKRLARKAGVFWGVSLKANAAHPLTEANKRFQPQDVLDPRAGGACVTGDQAPVRVHEAALQGDRENAAQMFSLIGLTNLYLARRKLMS